MTRHDLAAAFRRLHQPGADAPLVLPNAWDAMSARVVEEAGARAIATTSSGVSWALGRPDGEGLTRDEMVEAVRRIAAAVRVPVTADMEAGYGERTAADVAETVRAVIGAGAVGINLEDGPGADGEALLAPERQAERIAAARAAADAEGVALFVNARVDVYLRQAGDPAGRFDETVRRARVYTEVGADGVFVPGVADAATIGRLAEAVRVPLNVLAGPASPGVEELRGLGVARVSVGSAVARAAMTRIREVAGELFRHGTYETLRDAIPFAEADALFERAR
jgi:2-methylisocitrate lyase-like PEP mutase family enzyme